MMREINGKTKICNILKDKTKSICPICFVEIDAQVIEREGGVFLIKVCPTHGEFNVLVEKDPVFYRIFMNAESLDQRDLFGSMGISITHQCNLNCNVCYLPPKDIYEFSLEDLKKIIADYKGEEIWLAGGEPTIREDLPQVIELIAKSGKVPVLVTNGIRLTDIYYVEKLKDAGVARICISFNGFQQEIYKKINGQSLLAVKLLALRNLKKMRVPTIISTVIVKGVNDGRDLRRIYNYCLKNNSFIRQLRIRSSTHIGKNINADYFYLSEMLEIATKIIGIDKDKIINHSLKDGIRRFRHQKYHMPCHMEIDLLSLLITALRTDNINNPVLRRLSTVLALLPRVGLLNLVKMIFRKMKGDGRLLDFTIGIRAWPDKYRIDLGEIKRCPTGYLTRSNKKILPFCYAIIMNEKNNIL